MNEEMGDVRMRSPQETGGTVETQLPRTATHLIIPLGRLVDKKEHILNVAVSKLDHHRVLIMVRLEDDAASICQYFWYSNLHFTRATGPKHIGGIVDNAELLQQKGEK
jgi:hypothetical protein